MGVGVVQTRCMPSLQCLQGTSSLSISRFVRPHLMTIMKPQFIFRRLMPRIKLADEKGFNVPHLVRFLQCYKERQVRHFAEIVHHERLSPHLDPTYYEHPSFYPTSVELLNAISLLPFLIDAETTMRAGLLNRAYRLESA